MAAEPVQADLLAKNRQVATGFLEAVVAGDIERCAALLDPGVRWWVQGWGEMPGTAFLESLGQTIARSASRTISIGLITGEADRVCIQASGEFVFPVGVYANTYHYLFVIAGGRIVQGFEYLDTAVAAAFFAKRRQANA